MAGSRSATGARDRARADAGAANHHPTSGGASPARPRIRYPAGWVYAAIAVAAARPLHLRRDDKARNPYERIEEHASPDGGCILQRLPHPNNIEYIEAHPITIVFEEPLLPSAETYWVSRLIQEVGEENVRGASILQNYGLPLTNSQRTLVQHTLNLAYT